MRYEDYKIEDYVFMNKEYENWTNEEKQEVLDTFPESKDAPEILKALEQLQEDIRLGVVKINMYGDINKASAKSYANKHDYIRFGSRVNIGWYGRADDRLYVILDGNIKGFAREWGLSEVINYIKKGDRFNEIAELYERKEKDDYEAACKRDYKELNKERIDASHKAELMLDQTRIEVLTNFYPDGDGDYRIYNSFRESAKKDFIGYNYTYRNKYGELEMSGEVVSKEDADKITEMLLDMNIRIGYMIDKCKAEMELLKLKYKDIADANKEN